MQNSDVQKAYLLALALTIIVILIGSVFHSAGKATPFNSTPQNQTPAGPLICNCPNIPAGVQTQPGPGPCHCPISATNMTNSTANSTMNTTLSVMQQINYSSAYGFTLSQNMFHANSSSQCLLESISACNNNMPSQYVCANSQYANTIQAQYREVYSSPTVCPQFFMAGRISCSVTNNYCTVVDDRG